MRETLATSLSLSTPPPLLRLPYELHCEIASYLPLAALILYQAQLSRALRSQLFAGRLTVRRPHAFRLVEWRCAATDLAALLFADGSQDDAASTSLPTVKGNRSIWDTSPTATPRPAPTHSVQHSSKRNLLLRRNDLISERWEDDDAGSHRDVALFVRCMRIFSGVTAHEAVISTPLPVLHVAASNSSTQPTLRVISLLGRSGFPVSALTRLLSELPELHEVETVLMTSAGYTETLLWTLFVPPLHRRPAKAGETPASMCVETQAIVVPGPNAERGRGLQSGFKCFCFRQNKDGDESKAIFHVILHDWYDATEAEATEHMLEHSRITCNMCKRCITF